MCAFQSLTRDSNHSNAATSPGPSFAGLFQSLTRDSNHSNSSRIFHRIELHVFQSLTRDSNHSNMNSSPQEIKAAIGFNPSRGIAIIQTILLLRCAIWHCMFQSLTRDSNHSNCTLACPSSAATVFQSLTRDSNHSNLVETATLVDLPVSIPHAG